MTDGASVWQIPDSCVQQVSCAACMQQCSAMHTATHAPQTGLQTKEPTKKALAVSHTMTEYAESGCGQESSCREAITPMRYKLSSIDSTLEISQGSERIAATRLNVVIFLILFILLAIAPSQTSPSFLACTVQLAHNSSTEACTACSQTGFDQPAYCYLWLGRTKACVQLSLMAA